MPNSCRIQEQRKLDYPSNSVGCNMKNLMKYLLVTIILSTLIAGAHAQVVSTVDNSPVLPHSIGLEQLTGNISRPILKSVTFTYNSTLTDVNAVTLRERNDSLGFGGIYQNFAYANFTIKYDVINGTSASKILFHTDVPSLNSSLSFTNKTASKMNYEGTNNVTNFYIPYLDEYMNVSVSTYSITFNASASYITFFAEVDELSETADNAPMNLLSAGESFSTASRDEFYIQNEDVKIDINGINFTAGDVFGINYRIYSDAAYLSKNFTMTISGTDFNSTINIGDFTPGITVEWISVAFVFDTVRNASYKLISIDSNSVDVGDGTPTLLFSIIKQDVNSSDILNVRDTSVYTQAKQVTLNLTSSVIKGNITRMDIHINSTQINDTSFTYINGSNYAYYQFNATIDGIWNITTFAYTDKSLEINSSLLLIIDNVKPTAALTSPANLITIKTVDKHIKFAFNFADDLARVETAVLDLGNDRSYEVTNMSEFAFTYLEYGTYVIKLVVTDFAGNVAYSVITITIAQETDIGPKSTPFNFTFSLLAVLIAVPILKKRN